MMPRKFDLHWATWKPAEMKVDMGLQQPYKLVKLAMDVLDYLSRS